MSKGKETSENKYKELYGILAFIVAGLLLYFVIFPRNSGIIGAFVSSQCNYLFGYGRYVLPIMFIVMGWSFFKEDIIRWIYKVIGGIVFIFSGAMFLGLLSSADMTAEFGGVAGRLSAYFSIKLLGVAGSYIISFAFFLVSIIFITNASIRNFLDWSNNRIKEFITALISKARETAEQNIVKKNKKKKPIINKTKDEEIRQAPAIVRPTLLEEPGKPVKIKPVAEKKEKAKAVAAVMQAVPEEVSMSDYKLPSPDLLEKPRHDNVQMSEDDLKKNAEILQSTLQNFGVDAHVSEIQPGPVITRYEVQLAPGVKVSTITSLSNDISLSMKAESIRILAPIPGKSAVGIEIPNLKSQPVVFREIIESKEFKNSKAKLPIAIGKTVSGKAMIGDISTMPHLLVAGATGSGKSVCINTIIMSILYSARPDEVKFILVDPKMVELNYYQDMPHLYAPVITNPKEAAKTLYGLVILMEKRYKKFADNKVRNIESYNEKMKKEGEPGDFYVVVIIDELADLMLVASREVEESIVRLTQMARAVGIHLVLATQRPSVDVITGVIKANLPSRIAFQVMSKTDSRVILDTIGAEYLLGRGDMLYLPAGAPKPVRLQGAYLSEEDVQAVLRDIRSKAKPDYNRVKEDLTAPKSDEEEDDEQKALLRRALELVVERKKVSYDLLRANGFSGPKATNLMSIMEMKGFIEKPRGTNKWEIYFDKIEEYAGGQ
ncbi:MAG: DNA translocase FtsK [Elusimicrobiota bacterium]